MTFDALPAATTFPGQPLDVRTELLLSGFWTDITNWVHQDPVTIGRGHPDESTTTSASTCTLTLDNSDFRFTATNPTGPYYGSLIRNVPIRVSIPEGASYLRLENDGAAAATSYASCPDTPGISVSGNMEIQIDLTPDNWNAGLILAGKWAETGNQRTWLLLLNDTGTLTFVVSTTGSNSSSCVSTAAVAPPPAGRLCVRVTYATATGTCTFYTAPAGNIASATWTQLGSAVISGLTAALFDSTAPLQAGWCTDAAVQTSGTPGMTGKIHALRLLSGIGGSQVAGPDFTPQTPGTTTFLDAQLNTWTTSGTSEISNRKYRFHGEVPQWPQSSAPQGTNVKVPITAGGLLRRTGRAEASVNSAMTRANVRFTGALVPVAYWPGEDMAGSTQIASGIGGTAMTISGPAQLATFSGFACTAPIPVLGSGSGTGATFSGAVPAYTGGTDNVLRFLMAVPSTGDVNGGILARVATTGTVRYMTLVYGTGGTLNLTGYDSTGAQLFTSGAVGFAVNGQLMYCAISLQQSGSNIAWAIQTLVPGATSAGNANGTLTTATVGNMTGLLVNPKGTLNATAVGQWTMQSKWDSLFDMAGPLEAWTGETAGNRFSRLCAEESIAFRGRGRLADTVTMGAQTQQTLVALLQECADADRGIWTEPRQVLGYGYRTRVSVGNQTPAVVLDYDQDHLEHPLEPTEDDQIIVNDVTVTNTDGSSSRQVQQTGSLSVQPPPAGVGRYDQSFNVNVSDDGLLDDIAGVILRFGTTAEPRYPSLLIDLGNTALASYWYSILDLDFGDRAQVNNPPAWLPPGIIDQIIQGSTETLFTHELTEDWQGIPATPWNVAYADDPVYGRADTDGSVIALAASSGATTLTVASTATGNVGWTTAGGDFPFDLNCLGERITATACTSPAGTANAPAANTQMVLVPLTPGTYAILWSVTVSGTLSASDVNNFDLYNGTTFVTGSINPAVAGTYIQAPVLLTIGAGTPSVKILSGGAATAGSVYTATFTSPQQMTVTRSVNGVVKALPAGSDIRLFTPSYVSL